MEHAQFHVYISTVDMCMCERAFLHLSTTPNEYITLNTIFLILKMRNYPRYWMDNYSKFPGGITQFVHVMLVMAPSVPGVNVMFFLCYSSKYLIFWSNLNIAC